jgi:hypothetical protein
MSDEILTAGEYGDGYLQSPVDDLFSYYYTMQWAAVFHDREFAVTDVPRNLKILREHLLGAQNNRLFTTTQITTVLPLRPREYGSVVAQCRPVLRAWNLELQALRNDWNECQYKLEGQETKADIYIPLFLTFAVRGVATLAELVNQYTKDMAD